MHDACNEYNQGIDNISRCQGQQICMFALTLYLVLFFTINDKFNAF